jgi:nucleoside-diphosphate-sugar epimerase
MKAIVTGAAGFIGSHLAERLIELDYAVIGVDCFTPYYPEWCKRANLAGLIDNRGFRLIERDIIEVEWEQLLSEADVVCHLAAQPGVRASWGERFDEYVRNNIVATQRILEGAKGSGVRRLVFASSSSVYGNPRNLPTPETAELLPISPYGVTKLAAERLCRIYYEDFAVPVVMLRYFSVFGRRQRPDMAFRRFIEAILDGREIHVFGDGEQTRDFTHVNDIVEATVAGLHSDHVGEAFNVGGGVSISLNEALRTLEEIIGKKARVQCLGERKGDADHTWADCTKAGEWLGYKPQVDFATGAREEYEWLSDLREKQSTEFSTRSPRWSSEAPRRTRS